MCVLDMQIDSTTIGFPLRFRPTTLWVKLIDITVISPANRWCARFVLLLWKVRGKCEADSFEYFRYLYRSLRIVSCSNILLINLQATQVELDFL